MAPRIEGPSTTPARISPTTWGWLNRWNTAPTSRATMRMTAEASSNRQSTFSALAPAATELSGAAWGAWRWPPALITAHRATTATTTITP